MRSVHDRKLVYVVGKQALVAPPGLILSWGSRRLDILVCVLLCVLKIQDHAHLGDHQHAVQKGRTELRVQVFKVFHKLSEALIILGWQERNFRALQNLQSLVEALNSRDFSGARLIVGAILHSLSDPDVGLSY